MGVDWMFFPAEFKNGEWDVIELDNAELAFKARRLAALGRRLTLRTAEAPGEVAAVWYDPAAVVEFEG